MAAVRRYFAVGTSAGVRRGIVRAMGAVGGGSGGWRGGSGLREVARGPGGQVLYEVVR